MELVNPQTLKPSQLVDLASCCRRYTSLRDLLRVVRNKRTHFYEMPPETQAQMGPLPDGFLLCALFGAVNCAAAPAPGCYIDEWRGHAFAWHCNFQLPRVKCTT